jgi:deazaflavin-dependent oxidoreductase (nitroreductase family)
MGDVNDFNATVIEHMRANEGRAGAPFGDDAPLLILHHVGAKSGVERENPVMYRAIGDDFAVFASKAGAPTNPDWYHNLVVNPDVSVEVGNEMIAVTARVAEGDERETIWEAHKAENPGFAEYEAKTDRQIPVVILERRAATEAEDAAEG